MKSSISFENIWSDSDVVELKIVANGGESRFTNNVYVSYGAIEDLINGLDIFKTHIYGGIYDIELGKFGPEYANGAFYGRLHFNVKEHGKIFISIKMQTDFLDFGIKKVASEAVLYMITEPALLDNFIYQFKGVSKEIGSIALLECIDSKR